MIVQQQLFAPLVDQGSAIISPCGLYRYTLSRGGFGGPKGTVNFVLLNPSKADAVRPDPTLKRCVDYAQRWRFDRVVLTNLFAFRATEPREMLAATDPVGPDNDLHILEQATAADQVVLGWGTLGDHLRRDEHVLDLLADAGVKVWCLRKTASGQPGHPLFLRADLKPVPYEKERNA